MRGITFAFVLAGGLWFPWVASAHEIDRNGIQIIHPWVRETPKNTDVAAGYVKIKNTGKEPDRLIGASLKRAANAELHATIVQDGVSKMRPQSAGIPIAPGETVELKPGSFHIMFLGLKNSLDADELVDGSLIFEKAGTIAVDFYVEALANGETKDKHDHHH